MIVLVFLLEATLLYFVKVEVIVKVMAVVETFPALVVILKVPQYLFGADWNFHYFMYFKADYCSHLEETELELEQ